MVLNRGKSILGVTLTTMLKFTHQPSSWESHFFIFLVDDDSRQRRAAFYIKKWQTVDFSIHRTAVSYY
jgi:hypothetical protein